MKKKLQPEGFSGDYSTKLKLKMRISFFAMLMCFLTTQANVFSQNNISVNFNDVKLSKVLDYIENNSNYRFLYQTAEINLNEKTSIHYNGSVKNAVIVLFESRNVTPLFLKEQIVLKKKEVKKQQEGWILKGQITNATDKQSLFGVSIIVNNERGTVTDNDGNYKIIVKEGDLISISSLGFKTQDIKITNQKVLNVALIEDITSLDEIVLVGYGKQKRDKVSSAISSVSAKTIETNVQGGQTFERALGGLIKGVQIGQSSGRPGEGADVVIRGYTSPFSGSNNNPLYIVDGVPFTDNKSYFNDLDVSSSNPLQSINPNDIESIDVLKDAAATAIYGSRGANGVIIIKTKSGKYEQGTQVSLSTKTTFAKPINTLKFLNADQYKEYNEVAIKNALEAANANPFAEEANALINNASQGFGITFDPFTFQFGYDPSQAAYGNANTNWADEVYRKAATTREYSATVTGGGSFINYLLSLRHVDQEGLLKEDFFKQNNIRLNLNAKASDKLKLGATVNVGTSDNKTGYNSVNGDLNNLLAFRPDLPAYDENGDLSENSYELFPGFSYNQSNPLGFTTKNKYSTEGFTLTGNIFAEYEIIEDLRLKSSVSVSHFRSESNNFDSYKYSSQGYLPTANPQSSLRTSSSKNTNIIGDLTLGYNKKFEDHSLGALIGYSSTLEENVFNSSSYQGFINDKLIAPQFATTHNGSSKISTENVLNSVFGRINYNYDNKYFLTATLRNDVSSKFGPKNRSAWFPSVSASWKINNEEFLSDIETINNLKLRASYGHTGSTNVAAYSFLQLFSANGFYGGESTLQFSGSLPNPNIGWERTEEINLGLDFGLVENRIKGSVDLYKRTTKDALLQSPYLLESGANSFVSNFAEIENRGIEVDASFDIIRKENISWSFGANISKNINKLTDYNEDFVSEFFSNSYELGREINVIRGYVVEGIYQSQKEIDDLNNASPTGSYAPFSVQPGDYKFKDVNGDGVLNRLDSRTILGSNQADFFGGFNTTVRYKNFNLGMFFNYSVGGEAGRSFFNSPFNGNLQFAVEQEYRLENRWSPTNTDAIYPRVTLSQFSQNSLTSSATVYDTSYLRFKALKFGYQLPTELVSRLNLSDVAFTVTGTNLFTWTKFPGLDPESVGGSASPNISVTNRDPYPISKTWSLGVSVKF